MYPHFPEVLRAVRQNLVEQLMPALATEYAREQAGGLLLLLEHLLSRWDRALDALRDEHEDLRATVAQLAAATPVAALEGAMPTSGDELIAAIRALRAELAEVIASAPDDSRALRLVEAFCARQLARDEAAVAVGALTWE
jgi:hypothetical protein